jgi:hypothetical protein
MRLFVAKNWPALRADLRTHAPEIIFQFRRDCYVLTDSPDCQMRLMGMLPKPEETFLVGEWEAGTFAHELGVYLDYRLRRSGARLEDCRRIP